MARSNVVKYAVFTQVKGEWHSEGFTHGDPDEMDKQIAKMKEICEKENGPDTFRTFSFLDQPHKAETEEASTVDALLGESMG